MSKADSLRLADYLEHIAEAIDRIHRYVADMDEQSFLDDDQTQDAVVRNFEIIGEKDTGFTSNFSFLPAELTSSRNPHRGQSGVSAIPAPLVSSPASR
jgi:hypothetical protein